MSLQMLLAIGCFLSSIVQAAADIAAWKDRLKVANAGGSMESKKHPPVWVLILWFFGVAGTAAVGGYLLAYTPPVEIKTVTQTIEKPIPCPPAKTGSVTTRGNNSPANSGVGNTVTYGAPLKGSPQQ